ncbi:MAG: family 10 glycosylhydrolase, partial [Ruthenibacterium sp.]
GIQFDDYFYPTKDAAFDMDSYLKLANGQELSAWRRENVNTLVRTVYAAIKAAKPTVQFGISPQGNNDQNYNAQYSDVALWLSTPGYVDYIMPQIYWGYGYTQQNGSNRFAFENVTKEWAALPRDASVSLAIGLGAYRIGVGDNGKNDQSEWASGHNLADMLDTLSRMPDIEGFAIYRYEHLFANAEFGDLSMAERKAVTEKLTIK